MQKNDFYKCYLRPIEASMMGSWCQTSKINKRGLRFTDQVYSQTSEISKRGLRFTKKIDISIPFRKPLQISFLF